MITVWVTPQGSPPPLGTEVRVELEQLVGGKPVHFVGRGTAYGDKACIRLTQNSEAGRVALGLLREGLVDSTYWDSRRPTLRLR